jgi:uncharacterized protein (TIGR02118 family)
MSAKLVVLYGTPDDPDAFDAHYRDVHVPLVQKVPGLDKFEWATFAAAADGGELTYHVIAELHFADPDALQTALGTDEGKAAAADFAQIAPSGSRMFVAASG